MEEKKITTFTTPILVGLLVVASFLAGMFWTRIRYAGQGGKRVGEQEERIAQVSPAPAGEEAVLGEELESTGVGRFMKTESEVCQEDGKPIVYFFGRSTCPYCAWEHPVFEKATAKFGNMIAVHNNMDEQGADQEVWQEYSQIHQNAVPFTILGCRYIQRGSGDQAEGEEAEERNLTTLICKLTGGEPTEVCEEVSDLIEQIE